MELKTLCTLQGLSGREEIVRAAVREECEKALGKASVSIDRMGNVLAVRRGASARAKKVLLCAHMDEVGLMVVSATDEGLLHVRAIGGVDPRVLVSKRVRVGYDWGESRSIPGVIGAMAIHQQTAEDRKKVLPLEELYVDVGAKDKAEAERVAPAGTPVTFDTAYQPIGEGCVLSKALDDRVGVYNLLRLLTVESKAEITFAFTCQEEVGCRGAAGAAFRVQPDEAVILEGTTANDRGDVPETAKVCRVGEGVAISFMDHASIAQPEMFSLFTRLAKEKAIP
ncbi:MAG: M42 family peptidase, partial [Eubacteriales bacterium]|nr:M42 family peptidase [Eubacteriales bacterium]